MRTLWTPEGEHVVSTGSERPAPGAAATGNAESTPPASGDAGAAAPGSATSPGPERGPAGDGDGGLVGDEETAQLDELRRQLAATPVATVVANHCYGFFELAALHLGSDPPHLHDARLAIDALGAVLDGLNGRLGDAEPHLREALNQIRLAYVRIEGAERERSDAAGQAEAEVAR